MEPMTSVYPTEEGPLYEQLKLELTGLIDGIPYQTANLANAAALIYQALTRINWAGFYLMEGGQLVLGPFQGKPACICIAVGRGVCGTAVKEDAIQRIADVHAFPGHIACDAASRSEIVLPIHQNGEVVAVLDIDSPFPDRFSEADQEGLSELVKILEDNWH